MNNIVRRTTSVIKNPFLEMSLYGPLLQVGPILGKLMYDTLVMGSGHVQKLASYTGNDVLDALLLVLHWSAGTAVMLYGGRRIFTFGYPLSSSD